MIPQQLIQSLEDIKGFDKAAFLQVHENTEPVTSIRMNLMKLNKLKNENTVSIPWCPLGFYLPSRPSFTQDPLFHAGAYYVQEASSMFLWNVLQQTVPEKNSIVLDLCAAPGGKSTLLASYFTQGIIVSNEVIKQRAAILVENTTKWGSANFVITNNDPKDFERLPGFFDVLVIDAPCSGSGLFRKDKDAISEWSEDNVNLCSSRQKRIVGDAIDCLKENGILIYSTCSYSKQENEDVLDWLVDELNMESTKMNIPDDWGIIQTQSDKHHAYGYRFYPHKVNGEGFFIAAFKKNTNGNNSGRLKENLLTKPSKQETAAVDSLLDLGNEFFIFKHADNLKAFPSQWQKQLQILANNLFIKRAGIELGVLKGKDLIPSHELTMSKIVLTQYHSYELNIEQALQYLSKKEVYIETRQTGWALMKFEGINLGWIKALPNRINNYYPTEWRILKSIV